MHVRVIVRGWEEHTGSTRVLPSPPVSPDRLPVLSLAFAYRLERGLFHRRPGSERINANDGAAAMERREAVDRSELACRAWTQDVHCRAWTQDVVHGDGKRGRQTFSALLCWMWRTCSASTFQNFTIVSALSCATHEGNIEGTL